LVGGILFKEKTRIKFLCKKIKSSDVFIKFGYMIGWSLLVKKEGLIYNRYIGYLENKGEVIMNIKIVLSEKTKEKFAKEAIKEYLKRLTRYCKVKKIEVKNMNNIKKHISDKTYLILIDVEGSPISSEGLSEKLSQLAISGKSDVTFLVLDKEISKEIMERSDYHISISPMEMDMNILAIIIFEQIYRAFRIINNEPYHK